jgi:hypothetical protein
MRAIKTRTALRAALIASTAAAALTAFGASAQTPTIAPVAEPPAEDGVEVEEVVVTAQRRVQALSDVPISVDVVSNAELQRNQIVDLQDLSTYVPNLTVGDTPGENQVSMRGLSTGPETRCSNRPSPSRWMASSARGLRSSCFRSSTWSGWRFCEGLKACCSARMRRRARSIS